MKGNIILTPRYAFQAPEGYVFLSCDFSAIEMRVAAAIARCRKILDLYLLEQKYDRGEIAKPVDPSGNKYSDPQCDIHTCSASILNAEVKRLLKEEPWLANKNTPLVAEARHQGKILSFEVLFGGSANSISQHIKKTVEETELMLKNYFSKEGYWELDVAIKSAGNLAKAQGWVRSATGRICFVKEANAKGLEDANTTARKAFNSVIQGTAADINKRALHCISESFEDLNWKLRKHIGDRQGRLVSVVHDECNAVTPGYLQMVVNVDDNNELTYVHNHDLSTYTQIQKDEYEIGQQYGAAIKSAMEIAEQEIFEKFIKSNMPAKAELAISKFWLH